MKSKTHGVVLDDPGQLFFDFQEEAGAGVASTAGEAASPGPRRPAKPARAGRLDAAGDAPAPLQAVSAPAAPPVVTPEIRPAFITESRAAELFLAAAREHTHNRVFRACVSFKPFRATLYSFRIQPDGRASVKFHVAFRRAPEIVLEQAARIILRRRKGGRAQVERAAFDAFVRNIPSEEFRLPGARRGHRQALALPGRHHSLQTSFERINRAYFQSQLECPDLCWSPARAKRMLGSYHERNDRLIISQVFDSPQVPEYVLDYLMFHELLHKFLGVGRREDGRRAVHSPEFRQIEQTYRHFGAAQKFLKKFPA